MLAVLEPVASRGSKGAACGARPHRLLRAAGLALGLAATVSACDSPPPAPVPEYESVRYLAPDSLLTEFPAEADLILERPFGLHASEAGIAVTDILAGRAYRFGWDGGLVAAAGRRGEGPGEMEMPLSVRLWQDSSLWTADPRNRRINHYSGTGELLTVFPAPQAGDQFLPLHVGAVLVPSSHGSLLSVLHPDGTFEAVSDSAAWPDELVRLQGAERSGLRQLMISGRSGETVFLLHNVADFSTWMFDLDLAGNRLVSASRVSLPEWFEIESRRRLSEMQKKLDDDGQLLVPFNALHDPIPGTIWLMTGTLGRMIGAQLPLESDGESIAVIATNDEKRGLRDAVLFGDRLVTLYDTVVRVYSLKEVPASA
ncbi:MAG: hypothetical protein ABFS14_06765, partial [Gemmatimonadota bacterium]